MADHSPSSAAFDDFADYYDLSMACLDRATEISFYCSLVGPETRSLLELGCGTGTLTIPMASELVARQGPNARVVGIDFSTRMLEIARDQAPHIEWLQGDMRAPPVSGCFDLVVCCFNGVQLLFRDDDLLQAFRAVRNLLTPDGMFAFDLYRPDLDVLNAPRPERLARSFIDRQGRQIEVKERTEYDPSSRVFITDWYLLEQGRPDASPLFHLRMGLRQYFPEEIERLLTAAGLALRERYGDFARSPFTPASKRQVVVCGRS